MSDNELIRIEIERLVKIRGMDVTRLRHTVARLEGDLRVATEQLAEAQAERRVFEIHLDTLKDRVATV